MIIRGPAFGLLYLHSTPSLELNIPFDLHLSIPTILPDSSPSIGLATPSRLIHSSLAYTILPTKHHRLASRSTSTTQSHLIVVAIPLSLPPIANRQLALIAFTYRFHLS